MTEYRSEANDKRNRLILGAILSKRVPVGKEGDKFRHELSQKFSEKASLTEAGSILAEIAREVVKVPSDSDRKVKLLSTLRWRADHEASEAVRHVLLGVKAHIDLNGDEAVREFLYSQLVGRKETYNYPTKSPDCTCKDDEESDSKKYSYGAYPKPKAGYRAQDFDKLVQDLKVYFEGGGNVADLLRAVYSVGTGQ